MNLQKSEIWETESFFTEKNLRLCKNLKPFLSQGTPQRALHDIRNMRLKNITYQSFPTGINIKRVDTNISSLYWMPKQKHFDKERYILVDGSSRYSTKHSSQGLLILTTLLFKVQASRCPLEKSDKEIGFINQMA